MRWLVATVAETVPETSRAVTLRLDVDDWPGHRAGQHIDVRLTAEDGYSAQRSYSIASPPGADRLELTVVRLDDGEVSPYLTTVLDVGDQVEIRGPIGGYFVWEPGDPRPGAARRRRIGRRAAHGDDAPPRATPTTKHPSDSCTRPACRRTSCTATNWTRSPATSRAVAVTLTREQSPTWTGRRGRVDPALLDEPGWDVGATPRCFVCGPTPFVEAVADSLVALGHHPSAIRTERFGPTGG